MRQQVLTWLEDNVPASRIKHILGVEEMAIALASHHHLDAEKAGKAGLMHDLAKYFPPDKLLHMAQAEGIEVDPVCQENPHLLHADVSAIVARSRFGVTDQEILSAIANHTLGRPEMSELSCVLFIADSLEPNRGDTPELSAMRKVAWENLSKSVQQTSDYSLKHLLHKQRLIHPRTIMTRNWALNLSKKSSQKSFKPQIS